MERIETEIRAIALSDPLSLFQRGKTFTLRELQAMPPEARACIASLKVKTVNLTAGDGVQDTVVEIRLHDKVKALEMCAKHFGWLVETVHLVDQAELLRRLDTGRQRNAQRES